MSVNITNENFKREVLENNGLVLLDFWASWCGPCRSISPILDKIAAELPEVKVAKINLDEAPELAVQFQITRTPTLIVMKDGEVLQRSEGAKPKAAILNMLAA